MALSEVMVAQKALLAGSSNSAGRGCESSSLPVVIFIHIAYLGHLLRNCIFLNIECYDLIVNMAYEERNL
jgi:hypothetical protein